MDKHELERRMLELDSIVNNVYPGKIFDCVIVGGGAAGLNCAETLRYSGYAGKITFICKEKVRRIKSCIKCTNSILYA